MPDKPVRNRSEKRLRTCIAYRDRRPDSHLLRVVVDRDASGVTRVVADPHRRLPGRGAWLTPDLAAYELAKSRRAFARALRVSAPVDTGHVREYLVALARRSGGDSQGGKTLNDPEIVRKTEH